MGQLTSNPLEQLAEYELYYLVDHLAEAGRSEELHRLLALETSKKCNAWYQTHERLGRTSSFLADIQKAWRVAVESNAIGLQCRYALIISSINSISANYHPSLLSELVKRKMWTPLQALAYARQHPDPGKRFKSMKEITLYQKEKAGETLIAEALDAAIQIKYDWQRFEALVDLMPHLPAEYQREALMDALDITKHDDSFLSTTIDRVGLLAKYMDNDMLTEWLIIARQLPELESFPEPYLDDRMPRAKLLAVLMPHLQASERREILDEVFETLNLVKETNPHECVDVLGAFAPYLDFRFFQDALEIARQLPEKTGSISPRAQALIALLPHLPNEQKEESLAYALDCLRHTDSMSWCIEELEELASHLDGKHRQTVAVEVVKAARRFGEIDPDFGDSPFAYHVINMLPYLEKKQRDNLIAEVLEINRKLRSREDQVKLLTALVPNLDGNQRKSVISEILITIKEINHAFTADLIGELSPHLKHNTLIDMIATATRIGDEKEIVETIVVMIPELEGNQRRVALSDALQIVKQTQGDIEILAPYLDGDMLVNALSDANHNDKGYAFRVLLSLAPRLEGDQLISAMEAAQQLPFADFEPSKSLGRSSLSATPRTTALVALASHLQETHRRGFLEKVIQEARTYFVATPRIKSLAQLIPLLYGDQQQEILREVLSSLSFLGLHDIFAEVMEEVAPYLNGEQLSFAMEYARKLTDATKRSSALMALAPYLERDQSLSALVEAMEYARKIYIWPDRYEVLIKLAEKMDTKEKKTALFKVLDIAEERKDSTSVEILEAIVRHMDEELLRRALRIFQHLKLKWNSLDGHYRIKAISALSPFLKDDLLTDMLGIIDQFEDETDRARAMVVLAPNMDERSLAETLVSIQNLADEVARAELIVAIAPQLNIFPRLATPQLLQEVIRISSRQKRKFMLRHLQGLVPLVQTLGMENEINEMYQSVRDVRNWWP